MNSATDNLVIVHQELSDVQWLKHNHDDICFTNRTVVNVDGLDVCLNNIVPS